MTGTFFTGILANFSAVSTTQSLVLTTVIKKTFERYWEKEENADKFQKCFQSNIKQISSLFFFFFAIS